MRLNESLSQQFPQNRLKFIINKPLLIIRALLHTRHVLYTERRKEKKETEEGREKEWEGKMSGTRGRVGFAKFVVEKDEKMRAVTYGCLP